MTQSHSPTRRRSASKLPSVTSAAAGVHKKSSRPLACGGLDSLAGGLRGEIQKKRRDPGVGEMSGDAGAHGTCSEYSDA